MQTLEARTPKLSRMRIAQLVAADIPAGSYVNLGIGIPTMVARYLDETKEIVLHSENGILGLRGVPDGVPGDIDLINASKEYVQLIPGASLCDQAMSFAMMRGGHLDLTVLGAFQVAVNGDLASWSVGQQDDVPGIGGAMDLVVGARRVIVAMQHTGRDGTPKLVQRCTLPLTGLGVVTSVYTDLAVLDVEPGKGFLVKAMVAGLSRAALEQVTDAPLRYADNVRTLEL